MISVANTGAERRLPLAWRAAFFVGRYSVIPREDRHFVMDIGNRLSYGVRGSRPRLGSRAEKQESIHHPSALSNCDCKRLGNNTYQPEARGLQPEIDLQSSP